MAIVHLLFRNAIDTARKEIQKTNKENPNKVERERIEAALKQSKYALLKPEDCLTEKQNLKLEEVREVVPLLSQMHQQKEAFRRIFEQATDWSDGTYKLLEWLNDAQETFKESVSTICRWFGEVTGYFENRTTNGGHWCSLISSLKAMLGAD
jgi:transposase